MPGKITEIVQYISVFMFFLFALFLLTRTENKQSNRLLAAFLLVKMICIIDGLMFIYREYLFLHCPHITYIIWPFYFLYIPLLYLYTRSVVKADRKVSIGDLKYLVVFIFAVLYMAIRFYFMDAAGKRELLTNTSFGYDIWQLFFILYYPQSFFFLFASLLMLHQYRQRIKQFYSSLEKINLSWLSMVLLSFIIMYSISLVQDLSHIYGTRLNEFLDFLLYCSFLVFATMLIFKGLSFQHSAAIPEAEYKVKPVGLDDTLLTAYTNRLQHYMQHEKPYLYSTITLQDLADKLSIPPRNLSYLLNNYIKQNFFDYINSFRIEEAKQILQKQNRPKTVLEVLYSVGFNSKSVFNTAFKKNTGMTPTEFIKYLERA